MRIRFGSVLASAALVLALAACGGGGSANQSRAQTSLPPATLSQTTSAAATTTTQTTAPGAPLCTAADLSLSYLGGQGATGHGELGFELRNVSTHTCRTGGYPGVLFLGQSAQALPTEPTHTTHDYFGSVAASVVTLAPGQTASFRLGVTHGINSTAGCTTAYQLQVIPPNDTATLRVAIANGGEYECRTVTVSPVAPGTSAYP